MVIWPTLRKINFKGDIVMTLHKRALDHEGMFQLRSGAEQLFNLLDGTKEENYPLIDATCEVIITCNTFIKFYHELMKKEATR